MATIYFGFESGKGPISRLMQKFMDGKISHTFHIVDDGEPVLFEAVPPVVRKETDRRVLTERAKNAAVMYEIGVPDPKLDWLYEQEGKDYDHLGCVRFVFRSQEHRKSKGAWFCAEFSSAYSEKLDYPAFYGVDHYLVDPVWLSRSVVWGMPLAMDERPVF